MLDNLAKLIYNIILMFFPDNQNRKGRLKTLAAQMDQNFRRIVETSSKIDTLVIQVKDRLNLFKQLLEKIIQMAAITENQALKAKLKQLIEKISHQTEEVPVQHFANSLGFKIPKFLLQLVLSIYAYHITSKVVSEAVSKLVARLVRNIYMRRFFARFALQQGQNWTRRAFILRFPSWVENNVIGRIAGWTAGEVVGLAAGAGVVIALELGIQAIMGKIEKDQLQKLIEESLDCRFMSQKARHFNDYVLDGVQKIQNRLEGAQSVVKMARQFLQKGDKEMAYKLLDSLNINSVIDNVEVQKKAITDQLIVSYLKKVDEGKWTDQEFESQWKPLSDEEFEKKYPPKKEQEKQEKS